MADESGSTGTWPAISGARFASARRLSAARGRELQAAFLAEGPQTVREALAFGDVRLVIVGPDPTPEADALANRAHELGCPVVAASREQMAGLTDTVHSQDVVAVCGRPASRLDDVTSPRLVLLLDQVRDPGNVGTLIRSADAFGASAVVATTGTAEVWAPKAVRASAGSVFHVPVVPGVAFMEAIAWARGQGLWLLGADAAGHPLDRMGDDLARPTLWVAGNEAHGLPAEHLALLDATVAVPMWGKAESLNVQAAAAICLYCSATAQSHAIDS